MVQRPGRRDSGTLSRIIKDGMEEARQKAETQTAALAASPAWRQSGSLKRYCRENGVAAATFADASGKVLSRCGPDDSGVVWTSQARRVAAGRTVGSVRVGVHPPAELVALAKYINDYDHLAVERKTIRTFYILLLVLITLFILFVATWIALLLAKQYRARFRRCWRPRARCARATWAIASIARHR